MTTSRIAPAEDHETFLPLTAMGRASVSKCTRQSRTRKKNSNKIPLSFRSIANESIKCTDYTNNGVSHLIQFLPFTFHTVPFTRQHRHFLWGHGLSCITGRVWMGKD